MTRFRPCIDLHSGKVKQIVGGTLTDDEAALKTNFVSEKPSAWFAQRYRADGLRGGHVIQLGPGNTQAAQEALEAYPGGLQIGGGIKPENAAQLLDFGASHIIITSWMFDADCRFSPEKLEAIKKVAGKDRLVIDLSCRRTGDGWIVAMNRWQTPTDLALTHETLGQLAESCAEFLIHAADVEGQCKGIDAELVSYLGKWQGKPITYAGGAQDISDLETVQSLSDGHIDLSIGSALDIFGGSLIRYADCVAWNRQSS